MPNFALLNIQDHRDLRVQTAAAARFGDNQRFVAVIPGEFPHLAVHYPILVAKDTATGGLMLGALLGFGQNENLFLTEQGMESYRPLNLARGCFFATNDQIVIDLDSPRIDKDGVALFDTEGKPTEYLQVIMAIFRDLIQGTEEARQFVETLEKLKLLEAIDINASFQDGSKNTLTGVFTVNQAALRALTDEQVVDLFRRGYLQAIYLMINSLRQLPVLIQMKARTLSPAPAA